MAVCILLLDDLVIFLRTPRQQNSQALLVSSLYKDDDVIVKLKKCTFILNQLDYLGHVICLGFIFGRKPHHDAIGDLWILTTKIELHSFIGLFRVLYWFVSSFHCTASPVTARLCKLYLREL